MARAYVTFHAHKRWFFWPALITIVILGKLRILRDPNTAAKWLVDHAMRIEVN